MPAENKITIYAQAAAEAGVLLSGSAGTANDVTIAAIARTLISISLLPRDTHFGAA
jgi:hypothetical protein